MCVGGGGVGLPVLHASLALVRAPPRGQVLCGLTQPVCLAFTHLLANQILLPLKRRAPSGAFSAAQLGRTRKRGGQTAQVDNRGLPFVVCHMFAPQRLPLPSTLQILSRARNPLAVQPHLRKCFEAIAALDFGPTPELRISGMTSSEGEKVGPGVVAFVPCIRVRTLLLHVLRHPL